MRMPRGASSIGLGLDFLVLAVLLGVLMLAPIGFLVPFNDEWLRMNYLATHSVWEWTVMHAQTWVVRPTSEVIMALAALPITRPALAADFTPHTFLSRFHATCAALVAAYWLLLYANAAVLARSWRALPHFTLLISGVLVCWLLASELAYAFYWTDGFGNVLMPFTLCCCGLPLVVREQLPAALAGALLLLTAAFGHEVLCLYVLGFALLALALRRPEQRPWQMRALWAGLAATCLTIAFWQMFGAGPSVRSERFAEAAGTRYDLASAWQSLKEIDPLRALLSVLAPVLAIAIYRDRLGDLPERAARDARRQRWFWILLAAGTFLTCFVPLASVGLKKGRVAVGAYSVSTHLMLSLLGVVLYPLLPLAIDRALAGYRRVLGSLLPLLLLIALASNNIAEFREAVRNYPQLRAEAFTYMQTLFNAPKDARLRLCRPRHAYSKPGRTLTDRNQEEYFGIAFVYNRCPKR